MKTKKRRDDRRGKNKEIATIAVDYYANEKLFLGDPVEILEQVEEFHEFIGKGLAIKVKYIRPEVEKWVWRSKVVVVKEKGSC